jgi:hypothetical protein
VAPVVSARTPSSMKSRFSSSTTTTTASRPHHHYCHRIPASSREAEAKKDSVCIHARSLGCLYLVVAVQANISCCGLIEEGVHTGLGAWVLMGGRGAGTRGGVARGEIRKQSRMRPRGESIRDDAPDCDVLRRFQLLRRPSCPPPPIHDPRFT